MQNTDHSEGMRFETAPDGIRIRVGFWAADTAETAGQIAILHGRTEFIEKYAETIGELRARGLDVWTMDWRGQGRSERSLANSHKGHIDSFDTYIEDLSWFWERFVASRPAPKSYVLAHSMGGHIAMRALLEGHLAPDAAILSAPMLDIELSPPRRAYAHTVARLGALTGQAHRYAPGMGDYDPARARFEGNALTGDPGRYDRIQQAIRDVPEVTLGGVTLGWLDGAFRSIRRLRSLAKAGNAPCPVVVCTAEEDTVVSNSAQHAMCRRVENCTNVQIPSARHEILHETDSIRSVFWQTFDAFIGPGND